MPYSPLMVKPMRDELTAIGVQELLTAEAVDTFLEEKNGTALVVVNSVCGCAAGMARPGIALALQHSITPDRVGTVFAGQDLEATAQARPTCRTFPPAAHPLRSLKKGSWSSSYPATGSRAAMPRLWLRI